MSDELRGRRLLVTGGGSGIGLAVAQLAEQRGARVAVLDRAFPEGFAGAHSDWLLCQADVADSAAVHAAVDAAARTLGGLDIVVNSAGVDCEARLDALDDAAWARTLAVNLSGPMYVCRAALPHLRANGGGAVVNVASAAALVPLAGRSAYAASKAGLVMFGKTLAAEWAGERIRVNAVCPGAVDTPLLRGSYEGRDGADEAERAIRSRYALGRVGQAEEMAEAILFLAGPSAAFITGVALAVDGGRSWH